MKRYFAYIRVSTPKQGQGVSLQEQQAAIEAHAARAGLSIVEWFEEKETAAKEGRGVFSRMLVRLEREEVTGVIIHKIDRSARNLWDWANLGKLVDRGIDVQFAHDSIDLQTRGGRLSADIMAVVASDYVRNLKDEVRKGFYGRLKQGYYPLPAPMGYLDRGAGIAKEPDPASAPLVKRAFERYAVGDIGLVALTEELKRWGLHPRRSSQLSVNSVAGMLHNPFYIGIIYLERTGETFQGIHQPLVTKTLFDRVQAVLAGKVRRKGFVHEFIFRRFIRCERCGRHLVGEHKKGRYVYYRCCSRGCKGASINEVVADSAVLHAARSIALSEVELRDLRDMALEDVGAAVAEIARRQSHLQMRLSKCDERMERLTDALVDRLIDKDAYEKRKLSLLNERRVLLDAMSDPDTNRSPAQKVLGYLELPNIVDFSYERAEPSEKRDTVNSITRNFVVSGKTPTITLKSPYREIANWRNSEIGGPSRGTAGTPIRKLFEMLVEVAKQDLNDAEQRPPSPQVYAGRPFWDAAA